MCRTNLLAAVMLLSIPLFASQASANAAAVPQPKWTHEAAANGSVVVKVGWHCRKWRRKCAWRWGLGTRRYYRCLWRHAC